MQTFASLNLSDKMLKALESLGYVNPSPVQLRTIPSALRGESLLAQS